MKSSRPHIVTNPMQIIHYSFTTTANYPVSSEMGSLHFAAISVPYRINYTASTPETLKASNHLGFWKGRIRAVSTAADTKSDSGELEEEPPAVNLAFVHSVLLPDGTPDVQFRRTCGGQKLRDIMLDSNIELYGPHARPLLNCAGGGTCGTCLVEVVQGNEQLNPRTDKEKEKLKKKPKNWRLACQTTVGKPDSRGLVVIQQLPEWKAHEWKYQRLPPTEDSQVS